MNKKAVAELLLPIVSKEAAKNVRKVRRQWEGLFDVGKEERPHAQRTAINELRTLREVLRDIGEEAGFEKPVKRLRKWQKRLGSIRDYDICIQWMEKAAAQSPNDIKPGVGLLSERFAGQRLHLVEEVQSALSAKKRQKVDQALDQVLEWSKKNKGSGPKDDGSSDELRDEVAVRLVDPHIQEWISTRDEAVRNVSVETLHSFRRANKHLRDSVGFLGKRVDPAWKSDYRLLKSFHQALGTLNDLAVLKDKIMQERVRLRMERAERGRPRWTRTVDQQISDVLIQLERMYEKTMQGFVSRWPKLFDEELEKRLHARTSRRSR